MISFIDKNLVNKPFQAKLHLIIEMGDRVVIG